MVGSEHKSRMQIATEAPRLTEVPPRKLQPYICSLPAHTFLFHRRANQALVCVGGQPFETRVCDHGYLFSAKCVIGFGLYNVCFRFHMKCLDTSTIMCHPCFCLLVFKIVKKDFFKIPLQHRVISILTLPSKYYMSVH